MKIQCVYCHGKFECEELPSACPLCAKTLSVAIRPGTTAREIIQALAKNNTTVEFVLAALEAAPERTIPAAEVAECVAKAEAADVILSIKEIP